MIGGDVDGKGPGQCLQEECKHAEDLDENLNSSEDVDGKGVRYGLLLKRRLCEGMRIWWCVVQWSWGKR